MKFFRVSVAILFAYWISTCALAMTNDEQNSQSLSPDTLYSSKITLLHDDHAYITSHMAPDYWALSPYYVGQFNDRACSVAASVMIINAARKNLQTWHSVGLVTEEKLLKQLHSKLWLDAVGANGKGVSLDQLSFLLDKALRSYGINNFKITTVHTNDISSATKTSIHQDLVNNEQSDKNFIIANFNQGVFIGDKTDNFGHFAPVGAYDADNKKVLILDPDREWFEPYWVTEETFVKGMATLDTSTNHNRGYLLVELGSIKPQ